MKDPEEAKPQRHNRDGRVGLARLHEAGLLPQKQISRNQCLLQDQSYSEQEKQCYFQRLPRDVTIRV